MFNKRFFLLFAPLLVLFLISGCDKESGSENKTLGDTQKEAVTNQSLDLSKVEDIQMEKPKANDFVASPLKIEGRARGSWFFEAVFPVKLLDESGKVIAENQAQAQGDWMTDDFVPFKAELEFFAGESKTGTLVLERDNPSGLPENADGIKIPVRF